MLAPGLIRRYVTAGYRAAALETARPRKKQDLLDDLIGEFGDEAAALTSRLEAGEITVARWQAEFEALIARYHTTSLMLGLRETVLGQGASAYLLRVVATQYEFLANFGIEIQDAAEWQAGFTARAEMYAGAIKEPYWTGDTQFLPLPAMPAEGTQCLSNCLVGETIVAGPRPLASFERLYTGPVVEIRTFGGNRITCTPNHPILTPDGWMPAKEIKKGHYLVCGRPLHGSPMGVVPNDHQMPASIEEIARSLSGSSGESLRSASRYDFHGDVAEGDVYVVRSSGQLYNRRKAHLSKPLHELDLGVGSALVSAKLLGFGPGGLSRWRIGAAAARLVGGLSVSLALPRSSPRLFDEARLPHSAGNNAHGQQGMPDRGPGYSIPGSQSILRYAADVFQNEVIDIIWHPDWSGHVFNLQTETGWFLANGIVTHNCGCSWEVQTLDATKGDFDAYWRRSKDDSCDTCLERERLWNPVEIRGWELQ